MRCIYFCLDIDKMFNEYYSSIDAAMQQITGGLMPRKVKARAVKTHVPEFIFCCFPAVRMGAAGDWCMDGQFS